MWRAIVVGVCLLFGVAAIAQTSGQPHTNTPTVGIPAPSTSMPTTNTQTPSTDNGQPTVSAPTPGTGMPTVARPPTPRTASPTANPVDCRNGNVCPSGNVCLEDGMCAQLVDLDKMAGAVRTSKGGWCLPGFHENQFSPGVCIHNSQIDCPGGFSCGIGERCSGNGGCIGGTPASGPICNPADGMRCPDSSYSCSSRGTCIPSYFRECAGGQICDRQSACMATGGCASVTTARTAQIPRGAPTVSVPAPVTPQASRDQAIARCRQLVSSFAQFRQGMGEAWYAEQLGKSSCNADGTPR